MVENKYINLLLKTATNIFKIELEKILKFFLVSAVSESQKKF